MTSFETENKSAKTLCQSDDGGVNILATKRPTWMQRMISNIQDRFWLHFDQPATIESYDAHGRLLRTLPCHPCTHQGVTVQHEWDPEPNSCNFFYV